MTKFRLMLILTFYERTTQATQDLTRSSTILMRKINLMLPEAEVFHLCKHLHTVLWGPTQILDNIRLTRVLGAPSNRTLLHLRRARTNMDHNALTHIVISYPAITAPRNTPKTAKTKKCAVSEIGTHTTCPPGPIRLSIPQWLPPRVCFCPTPSYPLRPLAPPATPRRVSLLG